MDTGQVEAIPPSTESDILICPCCLQVTDGLPVLVDPVTFSIAVAGKTVRVKPRLFAVASYLLQCYPRSASRIDVYRDVKFKTRTDAPRALDQTIAKLRPVFVSLGFSIESIVGVGYRVVKLPSENRRAA